MVETGRVEKKYDLHISVPLVDICNISCSYCYNNCARNSPFSPWFSLWRRFFRRRQNLIEKERFVRWLDATGKKYLITLTGGEPFLYGDIIGLCALLSERHFIEVVTNLVSPRVIQFAAAIDSSRVVKVSASFHADQIIKKGLLENCITNYLFLKERNFNVVLDVVAHPENIAAMDRCRDELLYRGVDFGYRPFFGVYRGKTYPDTYTSLELKGFGIAERVHAARSKGVSCIAGRKSLVMDRAGRVYPCYNGRYKVLGRLYGALSFYEKNVICSVDQCSCPAWFLAKSYET